MFGYAVSWGHLAQNPFADFKQIRVPRGGRRDWHYVQPDEYQALLEVAPTARWRAFYALAYFSGARFGELFSLTPDNIDLLLGRVRIHDRNRTENMLPFYVKDCEARTIPIPNHAVEVVSEWLDERTAGSPYVLLTPERYELVRQRWCEYRRTGTPWLNVYMVNNTVREINRHAQAAALKLTARLTMHCFRKSCGQNWANCLPMNVVKEFMGHASIATTQEYYSTVTDEHLDKARGVMQAVASGETNDAGMTPALDFGPIQKVG